MTQDLLLELGTEDLPARYVRPLADALAQGIGGGLSKRGVAAGAAREKLGFPLLKTQQAA